MQDLHIPKYIKKSMDIIINTISTGIKNKAACGLCSSNIKPVDLKTLFESVGQCLHCLEYHTTELENVPIVDLLLVDNFMIEKVFRPRQLSVEKVLKGMPTDENFDDLAYELSCYLKKHFVDRNIKVFCEHEVESLTYKFFKKAQKYFLSQENSNALLWILFKRKESNRFFRIYNKISDKNLLIDKLALLFTVESECVEDPKSLLEQIKGKFVVNDLGDMDMPKCCTSHQQFCVSRKVKKRNRLAEIIRKIDLNEECEEKLDFNDTDSTKSKMEDTINIVDDRFEKETVMTSNATEMVPIEEISMGCQNYKLIIDELNAWVGGGVNSFDELNDWYQVKAESGSWEECVAKWASNREDAEGDVDAAMIGMCSEYKYFDLGWKIFVHDSTKKKSPVGRAATLCIKAFKYTGDEVWVERLTAALRVASFNKLKNICCEITADAIKIVSKISEEKRKLVLSRLVDGITAFDEAEEIYCCLLKGLYSLSTRCKSTGTGEICVKLANKVYGIWKKNKEKASFLFYVPRSKWDQNICGNMLCVCCETDCNELYSVCEDILSLGIEINTNMCNKLEEFYKLKHNGLTIDEPTMEPSKMGKVLIKQLLHEKERS